VWPVIAMMDDQFTSKRALAQQLFLVVDKDCTGSIEIGEFMHLFRNIGQVTEKMKVKVAHVRRDSMGQPEEAKPVSEGEDDLVDLPFFAASTKVL